MSPEERSPFLREQRERRAGELMEKIRSECADVITICASSVQHQRISRPALQDALAHLSIALACAHELEAIDA